jgi:RNA polymerase sigma-70 factor, ECF subfamily
VSALRSGHGHAEQQEEDSLESILGLVAGGDQAAFERLYDRVAGRVFGVARRVTRDPAQAEEVAQEVLVEVWRSAARFDPTRAAALTWILTIAHRRAVDRVRSAQAAADRDARAAGLGPAPAFDEVAEVVEARWEHEQVRRALTTLTDLQREAVTLAYYGGRTCREVAELLGVPVGSVKTRLRDGLIRLRDTLGVDDEPRPAHRDRHLRAPRVGQRPAARVRGTPGRVPTIKPASMGQQPSRQPNHHTAGP